MIAFAVVDQYQGQGLGVALLRHLVILARIHAHAAGVQKESGSPLIESANGAQCTSPFSFYRPGGIRDRRRACPRSVARSRQRCLPMASREWSSLPPAIGQLDVSFQ